MIKLAGITLFVFGIGAFVIGFFLANKFAQATGFMSTIVSLVLLYYIWTRSSLKPLDEEEPQLKAPEIK